MLNGWVGGWMDELRKGVGTLESCGFLIPPLFEEAAVTDTCLGAS